MQALEKALFSLSEQCTANTSELAGHQRDVVEFLTN